MTLGKWEGKMDETKRSQGGMMVTVTAAWEHKPAQHRAVHVGKAGGVVRSSCYHKHTVFA